MTHTLFIQLPSANNSAEDIIVDWSLWDADQKIAGAQNCPLSDAITQTEDHPNALIAALVPGADILQTRITVPAGQKRHLSRTLPFLVEEEIAAPIEEMHLCAGPVHDNQATVSVVSHNAMRRWLQQLQSHQIDADWLLPDSAALGLDNEFEVLLDSQGAHFYCPGQAVINTEFDNLTFIADILLEQFYGEQTSAAGNAVGTCKLWVSQQLSEAEKAAGAALATQFEIAGLTLEQQQIDNRFDFCCAQLQAQLQQNKTSALINLLNNDYRSTGKRQSKNRPRWRMLAATVVLCLLVKLILDVGSGLYLNYQSDQLDKQINTLYHDLFPQDNRIVNVKVQMQNHLKGQAATGTSSFMPLVGYLAEALGKLDGAQLQQLRYNDKNQTLLVDINVKNIQQLERLKQIVEIHNIKTSILSANEEQQWIKGRVRLTL